MPAKVKGGSTKMAAPSSLLVCKWRKKWAAAGKLVNLCEKLWIPRSRDFARVCVCVCNKFSRKVYQRRGFNKKNRSKKYIYRFWTERNVSLDYEKY